MADRTPADMPCKRDCPDRKPGCYCEKKKAWDVKKWERKDAIHAAFEKDYAVDCVRNPPRAKKARKVR